jgi:acyl-CoA synthetase (NDP forming)
VSGLKQEKDETRTMMRTFFSVLTQKLPQGKQPEEQEIKEALEQLKDVHKMAGLLLVSITPGSIVTLPALCALGRRYGIELLPSAFKKDDEAEIEILESILNGEFKVVEEDEKQDAKSPLGLPDDSSSTSSAKI